MLTAGPFGSVSTAQLSELTCATRLEPESSMLRGGAADPRLPFVRALIFPASKVDRVGLTALLYQMDTKTKKGKSTPEVN